MNDINVTSNDLVQINLVSHNVTPKTSLITITLGFDTKKTIFIILLSLTPGCDYMPNKLYFRQKL